MFTSDMNYLDIQVELNVLKIKTEKNQNIGSGLEFKPAI